MNQSVSKIDLGMMCEDVDERLIRLRNLSLTQRSKELNDEWFSGKTER